MLQQLHALPDLILCQCLGSRPQGSQGLGLLLLAALNLFPGCLGFLMVLGVLDSEDGLITHLTMEQVW